MKGPSKPIWSPQLRESSVVVFWDDEASFFEKTVGKVKESLNARPFLRMDPVGFFGLDGVVVHGDVASISESAFLAGEGSGNLTLFQSATPQFEWYRFFQNIFQAGRKYCDMSRIYTVAHMASVISHRVPRVLMGIFNDADLKTQLSRYKVGGDMDFISEGGQRPSLNSFLNWSAMKAGIPAAAIWIYVPFYLAAVGDAQAERALLEFFVKHFNLSVSFDSIDREIESQKKVLNELRRNSIDASDIMERIELGEPVSDEESFLLVDEVNEAFARQ